MISGEMKIKAMILIIVRIVTGRCYSASLHLSAHRSRFERVTKKHDKCSVDQLPCPPLWRNGGVVVGASDFRSEGRCFEARLVSSLLCCFRTQENFVSLHPGV